MNKNPAPLQTRNRNIRKNARKTNLEKIKARRESGSFIPMPLAILQHPDIQELSPHGKALFLALLAQCRIGARSVDNNGDLSITYAMMKEKYGFRSPTTLNKAKKELLARDVIIETRKGGKHCCSLFALTLFAINECDFKHDVAPTNRPPRIWSLGRASTKNAAPTTDAVSAKAKPIHNPILAGRGLSEVRLSKYQSH